MSNLFGFLRRPGKSWLSGGLIWLAWNCLVRVGVAAAEGPADHGRPPNILLITSEDNGPELGCYGDPYARTPHLDQLARDGVRFERAFVATASCSESRAVILTGRYPHQNGQVGLATHHYRLYDGVTNVVATLKQHGYRTGLIGKLHINPESDFPFDVRPSVSRYNTFRQRNVRRVAEVAGEFFSESGEPFFLMVNYADAHLPHIRQQHGLPETPLAGDEVEPMPWVGMSTPELKRRVADHYNCVLRLDVGIGLLMEELAVAGVADDTLVIYLGDHGAQFPRGKLSSYESSLHVPLLMRWPGRVPADQVRRELISTVDLVPTMLEAAGISSEEDLPGMSLLALVNDPETEWRRYLHCEYHAHYPPLFFPQRTVRDDQYKLIFNLLPDRPNPVGTWREDSPSSGGLTKEDIEAARPEVRQAYATWAEGPPVELYDLESDPYEFHNLAGDPRMAEVEQRLMDELHRWRQETADPLLKPENLARFAEEHDSLPTPYRRSQSAEWRYPEYLAPAD